MILPQQMAIRNALDHGAIVIALKETELEDFVQKKQITPNLVVTDSQAFGIVNRIIPETWPLTSFSIIFARNKGNFEHYLKGTPQIDHLKENDRILILESCTHQVSCEDIGRYKIPEWLQKHSNKNLIFEHVAGKDKPKNPLES